jgi:hypothetical protein
MPVGNQAVPRWALIAAVLSLGPVSVFFVFQWGRLRRAYQALDALKSELRETTASVDNMRQVTKLYELPDAPPVHDGPLVPLRAPFAQVCASGCPEEPTRSDTCYRACTEMDGVLNAGVGANPGPHLSSCRECAILQDLDRHRTPSPIAMSLCMADCERLSRPTGPRDAVDWCDHFSIRTDATLTSCVRTAEDVAVRQDAACKDEPCRAKVRYAREQAGYTCRGAALASTAHGCWSGLR